MLKAIGATASGESGASSGVAGGRAISGAEVKGFLGSVRNAGRRMHELAGTRNGTPQCISIGSCVPQAPRPESSRDSWAAFKRDQKMYTY